MGATARSRISASRMAELRRGSVVPAMVQGPANALRSDPTTVPVNDLRFDTVTVPVNDPMLRSCEHSGEHSCASIR